MRRLEIPKTREEILALDQVWAEAENQVFKSMEANPADRFLEIREVAQGRSAERAESAGAAQHGEFPYSVYEPIVKRILFDLGLRLLEATTGFSGGATTGFNSGTTIASAGGGSANGAKLNVGGDDAVELRALLEAGQRLLEAGIPYAPAMRYTFSYLELMDRLFLKLHPEYPGTFHRDNARPALEKILAEAPEALLYPSFKSVGLTFFVRTRSVPFHIVGLHPSGLRAGEPIPFADGYFMMPSEFAWHDIGHIEFMVMRDLHYLERTFKPLERVVQEWDYTRKRIMEFWKSQRAEKNLADATGLILFEILHERSYQFSFAVLKAQLDTPKWIEILDRKLTNNYYREFTWLNMGLFPELERARTALLKFINDTRSADQLKHIQALHAEHLPQRITHHPRVLYEQGTIREIEIRSHADVHVVIDRGSQTFAPKIDDLILAQVNPTARTPFRAPWLEKINAILFAMHEKRRLRADTQDFTPTRLILLINEEILVEDEKGHRRPLSSVVIPTTIGGVELLKRQQFEIEQVLGRAERSQTASFTIEESPRVYVGRVKLHEDQSLEIRGPNDQLVASFPLAEALVDPLQASDFKKPERKKH